MEKAGVGFTLALVLALAPAARAADTDRLELCAGDSCHVENLQSGGIIGGTVSNALAAACSLVTEPWPPSEPAAPPPAETHVCYVAYDQQNNRQVSLLLVPGLASVRTTSATVSEGPNAGTHHTISIGRLP